MIQPNDKSINLLKTLKETIPKMSERDKERLAAFAMGLSFTVESNSKTATPNE